MRRDDAVYLRHILDADSLIGTYTAGLDEVVFAADSLVLDGVVRQLALKAPRGALACRRSNARQTDS